MQRTASRRAAGDKAKTDLGYESAAAAIFQSQKPRFSGKMQSYSRFHVHAYMHTRVYLLPCKNNGWIDQWLAPCMMDRSKACFMHACAFYVCKKRLARTAPETPSLYSYLSACTPVHVWRRHALAYTYGTIAAVVAYAPAVVIFRSPGMFRRRHICHFHVPLLDGLLPSCQHNQDISNPTSQPLAIMLPLFERT
jgi:hypothetical protein